MVDISLKKINEKYDELEKDIQKNNFFGYGVSVVIIVNKKFELRLIVTEDKTRGIGLEIKDISLEELTHIPTFRGICVSSSAIGEKIDLKIICNMLEEKDLFTFLVFELIEQMSRHNEKDIIIVIEQWLKSKEYLFSKQNKYSWDERREKALFAELYTLKMLLGKMEGISVIQAWRGPLQERFDFCLLNIDIETKVMNKNHEVNFHGNSQASCIRETYLHAIKLKKGTGNSLKEIISDILINIDKSERCIFKSMLRRYGYSDNEDNIINQYFVEEELFYQMNHQDFPVYEVDSSYTHVNLRLPLNSVRLSCKCEKTQVLNNCFCQSKSVPPR